MSNRKNPRDYHELAKSKGYEWLGPEASTVTSLTWWKCSSNHEWYNSYYSVYRGVGCSVCRLSKGAKQVASALSELGIRFVTDKTIPGCKDKTALMFDFYFELNSQVYLVEYDGRQHFKRAKNWNNQKQFDNLQHRDEIKNRFAQENNYRLIRVRYDTKDIKTYLLDSLVSFNQPAQMPVRLGV